MLDINLFRENPEIIKENLKKKFQEKKIKDVDEIIKLDKTIRELKVQTETLRHKRNTLSQEINKAKKEGKSIETILAEAKNIPIKIKEIEEDLENKKEEMNKILLTIPNIMHKSVPKGKNENENVEIERIGEIKEKEFEVENHAIIAEKLGVADFETSAETSGAGFYYLKGKLAELNMALINFARDQMIKKGYEYVETPLMIREEILKGVFSNEEIENMSYKIEGEDLYLIATSEHSLIGSFIGKTIEEKDLPIKLTSYSMCFRKEIGSHGIDEKGLYRTHQFNKQEMIIICKPEESYKYYEEMLNHTKEIFKELEIPIRELECCSGDLAALKSKSADIEAWSPRQKKYFEVASCSNLTDAQSRRLKIRVKGKEGNYHPHTLNNTAIATSRALVAILENNQTKKGTIKIPKALIKYMNGTEEITMSKNKKKNFRIC